MPIRIKLILLIALSMVPMPSAVAQMPSLYDSLDKIQCEDKAVKWQLVWISEIDDTAGSDPHATAQVRIQHPSKPISIDFIGPRDQLSRVTLSVDRIDIESDQGADMLFEGFILLSKSFGFNTNDAIDWLEIDCNKSFTKRGVDLPRFKGAKFDIVGGSHFWEETKKWSYDFSLTEIANH